MTKSLTKLGYLIAVVVLAASCATTPKGRQEVAGRLKDSAPEKIAAQRSATRGLDLERDDERWGIEAAKERRRTEEKKKAATAANAAGRNGVDIRQSPSDTPHP